MKCIFSIVILLAIACSAFSQDPYNLHTQDKKAQKLFFEAVDQYNARNYTGALTLLDKSLKTDPSFIEGWVLKGDIRSEQGNMAGALEAYKAGLAIDPDYAPRLWSI